MTDPSGVFAPWVFDTLREMEAENGCTCTPEQEWYERVIPGDPTPRPSLFKDENGNTLYMTTGDAYESGMYWKHAEDCPRS